MSALSDRLIAQHDPEVELARREGYLADRARRMPGFVAHQEALARGEDLATVLRRTADRGHVRRRRAPLEPGDGAAPLGGTGLADEPRRRRGGTPGELRLLGGLARGTRAAPPTA